MRKKFLLMILILSLFSSMGGGYLYGQSVTEVSDAAGLATALTKSGTVKLVGDIEVEETIGVPYVTVILDLNGYSIKAKTNDIYPINNDGILTIEDTKGGGVIEGLGLSSGFDNNAKGTRSAGAELYIEGGTFKNLNPETGAAVYVHQGEATINGGIFYGRNIAVMSANGTVEINGGFIDGYEAAIVSSASVKIINATVISGQCRTENGGNIFTAPGVTNTYYEARIVEGNDHTSYPTLDDAIAAAKDKSGVVTVEILKKATMKSSLSGDYSSIKFVGKYTDSEIYLDVQGYITATGKNVAFENLTLSKSQGGFITNAGFMNVAFGVYDVPQVTYKNCVFANGAYAGSGVVTYTDCTFKRSHEKYGLWAYGDVDVTVYGGKFADYRGIKMYAEGAAKTVDLTVKNVDFSAVTEKPAIVLTYGESVTLEDNTYSSTGVFELDLDGAPNGTVVTADITDISCMNDNHTDCGVLVDGKIYTTIDDAKDVAKEGSTVTLFYEPETQVELSYGVTLNDNGYNEDGVVVVRDYYTYAEFNEYVRSGNCTNLQGRKVVLKDSERSYYNNKTAQFFVGATDVNITDPVETVSVSGVTFEFLDDDNTNTYTSGELQVFAENISFNECTFIGTAVSPWGVSNNENAETATFTKCNWKSLSGRYGVHQNRASNLTVTGCTFTNCERGIHTNSSTPIDIIITNNTFTGIGDGYGVLCLAENGNVGNATLNITGNTATGQTFLRQLNENATYEQISAILNTANNTYGTAYVEGSKVPTAKIGDKTYYSLQKAIDAAVDGNTITLIKDVTEDVEITQKAELDLTIDGDRKKYTGVMTVFGNGRQSGAETLTIKNIDFVAANGASSCIVSPDRTVNNLYSYSHNVTVDNCTFTDSDGTVDCAAIRHEDGGDKNWTVTKCTVDATMHSLLQVNNVEGKLTLTDCIVKSKNGVNLNSCTNVEMTGCNFDVKGYALRSGVKSGGNLGVNKTYTLNNNTLKSACDDGDAVIMFRASTVDANLSMTKNVVSGTTHISGNTADTKISADANYWDGKTGPVVAEGSPQVVVNSYYKDEALTDLVRIPLGDNFTAYTREDGIWGEVGGNAVESFVIKVLDAEGNVMGTTSLNNIDGIIDGSVYVTWSLKLDAASNNDSYWTMSWTTAPSINKMPAKVELWVDGVKVGGGDVVLNAPDGLNKINAANIDADRKILAYRQTLEDAVNNGDNVAILVAGTYNVPTGKDLTITGAVDGVKFDMSNAVGIHASMIFNNVTFEYGNANYKGLQHAGAMVYNNCTINGQVFLYGTSETFNNCTFNQNSSDAYNVWTYGAKEVAFNECTFNSAGKSVLVYNEGACATDLTVEKTTFKATTAVDGKAAIEIDTRLMPAGTEIVVDGATTAEGFSENTKSGSSLWNDKMVVEGAPNGGTNSKVTVDNVVVKEAAAAKLAGAGTEEDPYLINNIDDLVWFRYEVNDKGTNYQGKYIKLTADIDLNNEDWTPIGNSTNKFQGTFDGQDHTISNLVIEGGSNSNQGFFGFTTDGEIKNLTINNAKVSGRLNVGVVAGTPYTSKYTNIKVTGHVEVNGMAYVGGVGGKNAYANWTDITVYVDETSYVKATSTENGTAYRTYVGGVIGFNGEGSHTFKNITSNINVIGDVCDIGGIFGIAHYGNKFENITHAGTVTNTNSDAGDVAETGLIAGVWHNQAGTSVTFKSTTSTGTISVPNVTGVTFPNGGLIGAAYTTSNETSSTSGSLTINGEQVYPYVAKIGEVGYNTLAKAITAAQDKDVVTLLWVEGDAPIAMNASLFGDKTITITGTAEVDWSKGWLFVGCGGAGNGTVIFENAELTLDEESLANGSFGIHVSAKEGDDVNKNYGTVIFKNSDVQLSYLANRNNVEVDGGKLYVHYGFWVGGRLASENPGGIDGTAIMDIKNGAVVEVKNHNGMGVGYEGNGVMNITSSTFKYTGASFTLADEDYSSINVYGESKLEITKLEGKEINLQDGAIVKNSTVGGNAFVAGNVTFRGDNTFAMLYDFGTLTDYYGTTAPMKWNVEKDASLTLTEKARYGLGYGDEVTVIGSIENALEARENLTDADRSLFMHGLVAQESSGWNRNSKLTVENAYVVIGSNNSFGNKPGNYGGNYTFNFNNSVVDGSRITFYEANSKTEFTLTNSDVKIGTFMTRDADSKFTLKNSKVLSTTTTNGNDEGNYNAGELVLDKSSLEYRAAFTNTGVLNIGENSTLVAREVTNTGTINFTALTSTLATPTESLTINLNLDTDDVENPEDYKVVYKDDKYQVVEKVYVAKTLVNGVEKQFETLSEAINAVAEDGTVTLIEDETFTEDNRYKNGDWYEGVYYTGDKSFTIDLNGHTIGQNGSVNDYLLLLKNNGSKDNTITLKKGTIDAGTAAYCALATSTSNEHKITINTEDIKFVGNNSNGAVLKIRGGTELNVKAGTIITGTDNYVGIEAAGNGTVVNIYEDTKIYQNGTTSNVGSLVGASYNATVNVYGGEGASAKGGFIVMTSGGTINVSGGEWIANTDGTVADNNYSVLIAQNDNVTYPGAGKSIVNVTGGTFKGGYNCYANEADNSQINISGGNFNANPTGYVIDGYDVEELSNDTYNVIPTSGTQTRELEAGWHWFSTYVDLSADGQNSLDVFKAAFVGDDNEVKVRQIKNQSGYVSYNSAHNIWVNGGLLSVTNTDMYMINMKKAHTLNLTGDFADRDIAITLNTGWNWIGYPVNEEINLVDALSDLEPSKGDVIKSQTKSAYWTGTKWKVEGGFERMIPGEGYKYSRKSSATSLVYNTDVKPTSKSDKGREDNHWMVNTIQYPGNMTMIAMLSVDGEIVKDNYEIAAFANGECRGSARPIYDEDLDAYVLLMTIQGEEVEELTFKYYDVNYGTEYELSNRINYSDDAIVGSFDEPYMFNLGILNIEESSIEQINIYPNPATTNSAINLQAMCDKVEVFNALGVKVAEYSNVDSIDALETAGIYVIRVTIDGNARNCRLVVK